MIAVGLVKWKGLEMPEEPIHKGLSRTPDSARFSIGWEPVPGQSVDSSSPYRHTALPYRRRPKTGKVHPTGTGGTRPLILINDARALFAANSASRNQMAFGTGTVTVYLFANSLYQEGSHP